jgi:hypothetical protein
VLPVTPRQSATSQKLREPLQNFFDSETRLTDDLSEVNAGRSIAEIGALGHIPGLA